MIDGRDLCYAVAKACTEAIRKYGFYGYSSSTGGSCNGYGDGINVEKLLFLKAYALNALEIRELTTVWEEADSWEHSECSSFEKELELLLFDM